MADRSPGAGSNAKEGGALEPTIAFGVPSSASMAILFGAFLIHVLVLGPQMLTEKLDVTYVMIARRPIIFLGRIVGFLVSILLIGLILFS